MSRTTQIRKALVRGQQKNTKQQRTDEYRKLKEELEALNKSIIAQDGAIKRLNESIDRWAATRAGLKHTLVLAKLYRENIMKRMDQL